ncbi:MAG: alkaline phosphatase family protein [Planctomycetota bacterium]|jgi:predicted AlkP superfamily phosphohydrolase/phosphomutase
MRPERLVIIGLDGVPFRLLEDLAARAVMPHTAELISAGTFREMRSSVPEVSSAAWSSIITGANPAEHGIFGFTDLLARSYKMRFPNFSDLMSPTFWDVSEGKSVIMNVPSTYPVKEMNGVHISGFVSIDINRSVHPCSLIPQLKSMDYRLDVDSEKAHSDLGLFLQDLDETLTARIRAAEYLWDFTDWRSFMLAFTGTDRLMHFLFAAYEDDSHRHHNDFIDHFRRVDQAIGEVVSKLTERDALIMLSDHGFERLEKDVYVNYLLAREGLLTFKANAKPMPDNIDRGTIAFALDPARIYINQKGKYPAGSVAPEDKNSCLKDLEDLFGSLEVDGKKVVNHIYRKEDIYAGPCLESAPDMVLISEKGFNLKGAMAAQELTGVGLFTGKHTYHDAFLLTDNKENVLSLDVQLSVIDAGRLIKSLLTES